MTDSDDARHISTNDEVGLDDELKALLRELAGRVPSDVDWPAFLARLRIRAAQAIDRLSRG